MNGSAKSGALYWAGACLGGLLRAEAPMCLAAMRPRWRCARCVRPRGLIQVRVFRRRATAVARAWARMSAPSSAWQLAWPEAEQPDLPLCQRCEWRNRVVRPVSKHGSRSPSVVRAGGCSVKGEKPATMRRNESEGPL